MILIVSCRLVESPYKVTLEQLVGLEPQVTKTGEEEEDEESQTVLQRPLEICLEHSTISATDSSPCPLVRPQTGVAALHEYAKWITELNDTQGDADRKRNNSNFVFWQNFKIRVKLCLICLTSTRSDDVTSPHLTLWPLSLQLSWATGPRSGPCVRLFGADWARPTKSQTSRRQVTTSSSWRDGGPSLPGCPAAPPAGWRRRWLWPGRVATRRPSSATWRATASVRRVESHRGKVRRRHLAPLTLFSADFKINFNMMSVVLLVFRWPSVVTAAVSGPGLSVLSWPAGSSARRLEPHADRQLPTRGATSHLHASGRETCTTPLSLMVLEQKQQLYWTNDMFQIKEKRWGHGDSCWLFDFHRVDQSGVWCCFLLSLQVWQSSDSVVNVCSQLDWKRCVAVHLWFMLPPTASMADALAKYEAAFQVSCCVSFYILFVVKHQTLDFLLLPPLIIISSFLLQGSCEGGKYACAPLPPYLEAEKMDVEEEEESSKRPLYDLCFHLLKLYSDR